MGLLGYLIKCKLLGRKPVFVLYLSSKQVDRLKKGRKLKLKNELLGLELEQCKFFTKPGLLYAFAQKGKKKEKLKLVGGVLHE